MHLSMARCKKVLAGAFFLYQYHRISHEICQVDPAYIPAVSAPAFPPCKGCRGSCGGPFPVGCAAGDDRRVAHFSRLPAGDLVRGGRGGASVFPDRHGGQDLSRPYRRRSGGDDPDGWGSRPRRDDPCPSGRDPTTRRGCRPGGAAVGRDRPGSGPAGGYSR